MKISQSDIRGATTALEMVRLAGHTLIISVCMGCDDVLGIKDGQGNTGVSHGICQRCKEEQLEYFKSPLPGEVPVKANPGN
jgi:hypothetical protein